jgi:hypothetical protein
VIPGEGRPLEIARELYLALHGILIEELNGRLCALPDTFDENDDFGSDPDSRPRESRCCGACQAHWDRTKAALKLYEQEISS